MSPRKSVSPENRKGSGKQKYADFCKNVRLRRVAQGLSQEEVAKKMKWHAHRISLIEGGVFPAYPQRIIDLASALECSIDSLFGVAPDAITTKKGEPEESGLHGLRAMYQKLSLQLAENLACAESDEKWRGTVLRLWAEVLTILEGLGPGGEQSGQQSTA